VLFRELIFTEKDIVASPVLDREKAFLVIMQVNPFSKFIEYKYKAL